MRLWITWRATLFALAAVAALSAAAANAEPYSSRVDGYGWSRAGVRSSVDYWASYYGISQSWLERVIFCESSFNPYPRGSHVGPAQFVPSTFRWMAAAAGVYGSMYDPDTNIRVAAWAHANGFSSEWSCG